MAEENEQNDDGNNTDPQEVDVSQLQADLAKSEKKRSIEREHRSKAEDKFNTLNDEFTALKSKVEEAEHEKLKAAADKSGDYKAIRENFAETISNKEAAWQAERNGFLKDLESLTHGQSVSKLSSEIFGEDAELLEHVVSGQLKMVRSDAGLEVVVVDSKGNDRGITLDELAQEIKTDSKYARYVVGSTASGGGATGSSAKIGGAGNKTITRVQFDALGPTEAMKIHRDKVTIID